MVFSKAFTVVSLRCELMRCSILITITRGDIAPKPDSGLCPWQRRRPSASVLQPGHDGHLLAR